MRFNDFVNNVRVERAKSFLLESDLNIAECLLKIFQVINDIFVGGKKITKKRKKYLIFPKLYGIITKLYYGWSSAMVGTNV